VRVSGASESTLRISCIVAQTASALRSVASTGAIRDRTAGFGIQLLLKRRVRTGEARRRADEAPGSWGASVNVRQLSNTRLQRTGRPVPLLRFKISVPVATPLLKRFSLDGFPVSI